RMSGHGKKRAVAGKPGTAPRTSKSKKAGLQFPVSRVYRLLRRGNYADRIGFGAAIYLTAVIEYMTAEVLEAAGTAARENKKTRILPRHIVLAVKNDDELDKFCACVTIAEGGVMPNIAPQLLPKKTSRNADPSQE
ncbi:H2A2 protein, partial [Sclerurus mexicanus]|nr:H2A2 protein [Sclerurus mexicanus]NXF77131.1 H2A2 protein [Sclerurus mexicanus]